MEATFAAVAPLRIGIIGVGRIGRMHAELLERQVPGASRPWSWRMDPSSRPWGWS